jgi:eukaryotic-like serine/threonine-protein kinase
VRPGTALERSRWADELMPLGKIGRYTILGQIAGGGMGSVFVALMQGPAEFSRRVAVKCLRTRWLDDPKYVARFTSEVRLSARIRHPNVVQTLDVVEEAGELFLVMEYVDGVTLSALLADASRFHRPLPIGLVLGIMASVLRGLHAAHETTDENGAPLHIVHRDVSPQNIMLAKNGHVQVLDFGAAKAVDHSQHTAAGVLVGKLAYMAPEQVRGERSSPRSDVFAAGVVLWEALVGKRLFYDPGLGRSELLHALVLKPVARPSTERHGVPAALDEVVRKALDRNPHRRYQTALEFAVALEEAGAASGYPAAHGASIGGWVTEICAARLAEKEAVLQSGMAAIASEVSGSTPLPAPHALVLPSQHTLPGFVLASAPRPLRSSRSALVAAVLVVALGIWAWNGATGFIAMRSHAVTPPMVGAAPSTLAAGSLAAGSLAAGEPLPLPALSGTPVLPGAAPDAVNVNVPAEGEPHAGAAPLGSGTPVRAPRGVAFAEPAMGVEPARSFAAAAKRVRRAAPAPSGRFESSRQPARTPGCEPPTYMDAAGIRHFKKDCL